MDTLTHALAGAVVARAVPLARPLPLSARLLAGAFAGAFPDADVVMALFTDPLTYINLHRGVTHSLVLLPLWAVLLALAFAGVGRLFARREGWRHYWGLCALALLAHVGGDVITSYGTQILAPFSGYKASFPTTFIIDPWFTAILLLGLLGAVWRGSGRPAALALVAVAGYVAFQAVLLAQASAIGERFAERRGWGEAEVRALPQPLSPFHWKVIVAVGEVYYTANIDLWAGDRPVAAADDDGFVARLAGLYRAPELAEWQRYDRFGREAEPLVREVWNQQLLSSYRRFAEYPALYRVDWGKEAGTCVWFVDLRFTVGAGELLEQRTPFRYGLCRGDATRPWSLYELQGDGPKMIM